MGATTSLPELEACANEPRSHLAHATIQMVIEPEKMGFHQQKMTKGIPGYGDLTSKKKGKLTNKNRNPQFRW
jgi:hypothetical protein